MKPILFNADMVRAILDGRKTVTRRVVKGADSLWGFDGMETNPAMTKIAKSGEEYPVDMPGLWAIFESEGYPEYPMIKAPYQPGEILYVRETWAFVKYRVPRKAIPNDFKENGYIYKADDMANSDRSPIKWRPSIHMPKEAARIFLRVTDVRVERLQDITEIEAIKEGANVWGEGTELEIPARSEFCQIWDSTIKSADITMYGWDANPWVWVIEFERISKDDIDKAAL